jgi:hypothetical protein
MPKVTDHRGRCTHRREEEALQAAAMDYLDRALPLDAVAHHSPGEGKRSKRAQGLLKRSGYKRGWPDIEIIWKGRSYFIEMKTPTGVVTPDQRLMHSRLLRCGAVGVVVCRSVPAVEQELRAFGIPVRGTVMA